MLLISILLPVLGAVALFIWRPRDVRACHALTMTATLATSACVAWCIFTPGGHPITLLKLSDLLSHQLQARRPGARLWRAGGLPVAAIHPVRL